MSLRDSRLEGHLHMAVIENVGFLMETGCSFEVACTRVGRDPSSVAKLYERHGLPNPANKESAA